VNETKSEGRADPLEKETAACLVESALTNGNGIK